MSFLRAGKLSNGFHESFISEMKQNHPGASVSKTEIQTDKASASISGERFITVTQYFTRAPEECADEESRRRVFRHILPRSPSPARDKLRLNR